MSQSRRVIRFLAVGLVALAVATSVSAQGPSPTRQSDEPKQSTIPARPLSPAERRAMEDIVREYILTNPEVIIESIQNMREREQRQARNRAQSNLVKLRGELVNDPATPAGGNPDGDVTIVEFFDYRCGYCKRVFPDVLKVLQSDKSIRLVFREFPILGPDSLTAAKAALAAWLTDKGKYQPFHTALMQTKGALPETRVMSIATEAGLDADALKRAMDDPRIEQMIERNYALAEALEINGTPAFVIGDHVIRGAIDLVSLRQLISAARGS
ncbi:MAG: DsbA family protein [Rhodospirillales bacterium]